MRRILCVITVLFLITGLPSQTVSMDRMDKQSMRSVSGQAGVDIRFDIRLNASEFGSLEGTGSEFRWTDKDGAPNIDLNSEGHLVFENVFGSFETGMDDSVEHGIVDIGTIDDSLGTNREVVQIEATENDPNQSNTWKNEDDNNDGIFDDADVTFENTDLFITDTRIKYSENGCCGDGLGQLDVNGDFGLDGTKLRIWGNP